MLLKPWVRLALGLAAALFGIVPLGCAGDGGLAADDGGGTSALGGRGAGGGSGAGTGGVRGTGGGGGPGGMTAGSDAGAAGGSDARASDAGGDARGNDARSADGGGAVDGGGGPDATDPATAGVVAAGVRWFGRVDVVTDPTRPRFSWSGTGFIARFSGTGLGASLNDEAAYIFKAVVDGQPQPAFTSASGTASYSLASGLAPGTHTVELYRQTEGEQGASQLLGLTVTGGTLLAPPAGPARLIEVIGDSITCGYGNLGTLADTNCYLTESHWDAYPSVMARALGAEVSTVAASGRGVIRNYAGDTTDTLPMLYDRIIANRAAPAWDFRVQPQAVMINLGTNDISNSKGDPGVAFENTYRTLVETIRARYPRAYIVCTIGPLTSTAEAATIVGHLRNVVAARNAAGDTQIAVFDQIAPQTADKFACAYHPNVAENAIMAGQLADYLRARLGW